jgi:hypothetical protein
MAIAFDAVNSTNADVPAAPITLLLNVVSASNGIVLVNIVSDSATLANRTVTTVSYNGTTLTNLASATIDATPNRSEVWYLLNTTVTGSHTVSVTMGGPAGGVGVGAISFTGVDQVSPIDASSTASGLGNPTGSITTVADNAFLVEGCLINTSSATSLGPNSGQTQKWNILDTSDGIQLAGGYKGPISPAAPVSESWAAPASSANYVYSLVSLKPASTTNPLVVDWVFNNPYPIKPSPYNLALYTPSNIYVPTVGLAGPTQFFPSATIPIFLNSDDIFWQAQ